MIAQSIGALASRIIFCGYQRGTEHVDMNFEPLLKLLEEHVNALYT